jgi:RNA polymerase sigma factor for flagellar operon FliA
MVPIPARAAYRPADPDRELLRRHAPLLERCARRLAARTGYAVSPDDLWSAGALGLLDAARRYDPTRDVRFETFAEHRVRGAMLDEMRRMDHLPRRLRAGLERIERERSRLGQALGREPEAAEIAGSLGLPPEEVAEALQLMLPVVPVEEDLLRDRGPAPDDTLAGAQLRDRVVAAIEALPERLRILLALYYDEGLTYREIAKGMGISEPRVCQLHSEAVKRLRGSLSGA